MYIFLRNIQSIKADTNLKSLNMDSSTEMEDFDKKVLFLNKNRTIYLL